LALLDGWKEHDLFDRYNFSLPWNSPTNAKLLSYDTGDIYWCPSGDGRRTKMTDYLAVVGPRTAWPGNAARRLEEITDGPENTILLIEVAASGIHWMQPGDIRLEDLLSPSSNHPRNFNALFADGSVQKIRKDLSPETFKALVTVDGGEVIDPRSWRMP
jgi:prepilin-type processing-associated H-X9-DG protein